MKQETKRLSSILIAGLILIAALVVYFEFVVPAYTDLQAVKGQVQSEQALYANENQVATKVKSLLASYQSDAASSQAVAMALPVGPNVAGALAQVYGIAANTGITLQGTGISVQAVQATTPPPSSDASSSALADVAAAGSIVKPIGSVSLQVTGSGTYENLKNFLNGLATNIRIFDVTAISIQPGPTAAGKAQVGTQDMFNYTITVVTYYQSS